MKSKFNLIYEQVMNLLLESRLDDYLQQLKNKNIDNAEQVAQDLFALNDPKKEKCFIWWILKKTVIWPEDADKMEQAFNIINKQHLNFQDFERPMEVINRMESRKIIAKDINWSPDKEPAFLNPHQIGPGIISYDVEDSKEGQKAVRKAIDVNWGYDKNPWCLAARKEGILRHNADEISRMSDEQKQSLGLYSDDELATAWNFWNKYNAYPKRIAFQNGKLLAFSANSELTCVWWDRNDKSHSPEDLCIDDEKFINKAIIPILTKMAKSKDYDKRIKVARNENTPADVLKMLANDENWEVREYVAGNENTPIDILKMLSNDENDYVRISVAWNENTPVDTLKLMTNDKNSGVRSGVAWNKNTPVDALKILANDKNSDVRKHVAENKNTSTDVLKMLVNDKNNGVRGYVALNENTPPDVLKILANDEVKDIRNSAKNRLKMR